jgi:hypothetical protein
VLGQDRRNMGVMVLHGDRRQAQRLGVSGRGEIGMQIVGDDLRANRDNPLQMIDGLLEEADRFRPIEIAHMLRDEGFIASGEGHRVLEVGADRQHRRPRA